MNKFYKFSMIFLLAINSLAAKGSTYYIANTGNDSLSGLSPTNAWKTIAKIYSVTFVAGDSLLLKAGDTLSGLVYLSPIESGTAAHPIVISSYGTGTATINAGTGSGIFGYNNAGITISNLKITGSGDSSNTESGIFFYVDTPGSINLNSIIIDSVDVSGFNNSGIEILSYPPDTSRSGITNISITHTIVHDNRTNGIMIWGFFKTTDTLYSHHNLYIGHCSAYNNSSGSGIVISQVDSAVIEYCEAYNNGSTGAGMVGIWAWDANNIIIQHCESHDNHTIGSDGDGFDLDGGVTNSVMQYNYSHNNDGAGYLVWQFNGARPYRNNTVRFNISENDSRTHNGYYGMVAIGSGDSTVNTGIHDVFIYNNTFFKNRIAGNDSMQGPAVSLAGDEITGIKVYNNIFMLDSTSRFVYTYNPADITFLNNDYWSNKGFWITENNIDYTSIDSWATTAHQEIIDTSIVAHLQDPLLANPGNAGTIGNTDSLGKLINYYKLADSSPMLDSGINLYSAYSINTGLIDFFGTLLPSFSPYDIGAYQHFHELGVFSISSSTQFEVYPNPCHGFLNVVTKDPNSLIGVYLYDMMGKCLLTDQVYGSGQINTSNLVPGIYTLILMQQQSEKYINIVKY